ncbi:MAG: hypothetical protein IMF08_06265 [Proteobacteria bacterium]|nr:hypothetical protein [Pseudomonadota bacterium]
MVLSIVVAVTYIMMSDIKSRVERVDQMRMPSADIGARLAFDIQSSSLALRDFMRAGDPVLGERRVEIWRDIDR